MSSISFPFITTYPHPIPHSNKHSHWIGIPDVHLIPIITKDDISRSPQKPLAVFAHLRYLNDHKLAWHFPNKPSEIKLTGRRADVIGFLKTTVAVRPETGKRIIINSTAQTCPTTFARNSGMEIKCGFQIGIQFKEFEQLLPNEKVKYNKVSWERISIGNQTELGRSNGSSMTGFEVIFFRAIVLNVASQNWDEKQVSFERVSAGSHTKLLTRSKTKFNVVSYDMQPFSSIGAFN